MHHLVVDPHKRLVRFALIGFLDEAASEAFDADLRAAVRDLTASGPSFDILADLREHILMHQSEAGKSRERMKWLVDHGLRKSANIMTSALVKMQIERLASNPRFRYFATEEEALAWLAE